jgi:hypothetical protein
MILYNYKVVISNNNYINKDKVENIKRNYLGATPGGIGFSTTPYHVT